MQIGTTGASPQMVVRDFNADYQDMAQNPTAYFFGQQGWRNAIAPGFGCDPYELVMSFNTTDGLFRIMLGLQWERGDEMITTNMEESAGISVLSLLADRYGVVLKPVAIPTNDAYTDAEVLDRFEAQLTSRTKAVLFSSPIYLTGTRLKERELCLWAARGDSPPLSMGTPAGDDCAQPATESGAVIPCPARDTSGSAVQARSASCIFATGTTRTATSGRLPRPTSASSSGRPDGRRFGTGLRQHGPCRPTSPPTAALRQNNANSILFKGQRSSDDDVAALLQLLGIGAGPSQHALYSVASSRTSGACERRGVPRVGGAVPAPRIASTSGPHALPSPSRTRAAT